MCVCVCVCLFLSLLKRWMMQVAFLITVKKIRCENKPARLRHIKLKYCVNPLLSSFTSVVFIPVPVCCPQTHVSLLSRADGRYHDSKNTFVYCIIYVYITSIKILILQHRNFTPRTTGTFAFPPQGPGIQLRSGEIF